jgi:SAM-dependent methyltransferase
MSGSDDKQSDTLGTHRAVWQRKPVLRAIYERYYRDMIGWCIPGRTLEIGGGTGNLKEYLGNIIAVDIQHSRWLDVVADAHRLPFSNSSVDNIVMFDVLHHLERPRLLFAEATRILRQGGRLVAMEPAITPLSHLFYAMLHPEPVRMREDPLADGPLSPDRDPYDSNQAIPTLLFRKQPRLFQAAFPALKLRTVALRGLFAYPLSGGFRPWSLIPLPIVKPLLRIEDALLPILGPAMAFRMLIVIERI